MATSTTSLIQASPVARTAFDSIQAKKSALCVGYRSMVVENVERYNELLHRVTSGLTTKRQTPLVNAGYAFRVRAVSHSISAFITYHQHINPARQIQIVFMGCGIDVLGLWSRSLVPECAPLRIVELDMPSVCSAKKALLDQLGLVTFRESYGGGCAGVIESEIPNSGAGPDYVLWPVDLTETAQLDQMLSDGVFLDPSIVPTLVISEVVLSYLDPTETNHLVKWCSSNLTKTDGSAMTALEPMGFEGSTPQRTISVYEGYRRDYCQRFDEKMERGNAMNAQAVQREYENTAFHPIGTSGESISYLFQSAGYNRVHVENMGSSAAHASTTSFQIPEIFDEHSALVMHLRSYYVITAFPCPVDGAFERLLCPASFASLEIPPLLGSHGILYTTITPEDEEPMTEIFRKSYEDLASTHTAVRKIVKGILKLEFALSIGGSVQSDIALRYSQKGGCFVVAVSYLQDGTSARSVVGCVGVRASERKDARSAMEIFRLVVDERYRRRGIGRQLLQTVETFARSRSIPKIFASTITNLENALLLYEACGYQQEGDTPLGSLTMRTYSMNL